MRITGRLEAPAGASTGAHVEFFSALADKDNTKRQLAGEDHAPPLASTHADASGRVKGYMPIEYLLVPLVEDRELQAPRHPV